MMLYPLSYEAYVGKSGPMALFLGQGQEILAETFWD